MLTSSFVPKPKPKLLIAEVRAEPTHLVMPGWDADEPSLLLVLRSVIVKPPAFAGRTVSLAVVGLHALARRYERGQDRADNAVLRDLCPLGRAWPAAVTDTEDEISIPATGGGVWRGAVMMIGSNAPVLCVRTYVVP